MVFKKKKIKVVWKNTSVCLPKDPGTCNGEITNTIPSKINMQELITKYALNASFSR